MIFYSNKISLSGDYDELEPMNQKNSLIVSSNNNHSNEFAENYPEVSQNSVMWQVAAGVDFVDKEYFTNLLEKNNVNVSTNGNYQR